MQNESITLRYTAGGSDKVYQAQLESRPGGYVVHFQFGRYGGTLKAGTKTPQPVEYAEAKKLYDSLVREKQGKGYSTSAAGTPFAGSDFAPAVSGIQLQLSNPIDAHDAVALLGDPGWYVQEKMDGERRAVVIGPDETYGINKKGLRVPLPASTAAALRALGMHAGRSILDGELIGEVLYVFDLLELYDVDLRGNPLSIRLDLLDALPRNALVRRVQTARSTEEKQTLSYGVRAASGEGVLFKRAKAAYAPGRPASGGDSLKFKYVEEATVRVERANLGKRSVVMAVRELDGAWREVGSVTIPQAEPMPEDGAHIEVRYLYAMPMGGLIQPVYKGVRPDQSDEDCTAGQLKLKPQQASQSERQPEPA